MITSRGWWFLMGTTVLVAVAVLRDDRALAILGFSLFLWFFWEWALIVFRVNFVLPHLQLIRRLLDDKGAVETLWAGRSFDVELELSLGSSHELPYLRVLDFAPFGLEQVQGKHEWVGRLTPKEPMTLEYTIRSQLAGKVRFEGVRLQIADAQGFFYHMSVLHAPAVYRVLPPLADAEGHRPSVKRQNLLPSPGLHRHLRPGSASELLDLRDYMPGDPPRTIAWKVSARRDRLITKEFESEVPLRCTFFVDVSSSVRVNQPGGNALSRLVEITASTIQAATGARDLAGLCMFDEERVLQATRPARTPRHVIQLLKSLADAAGMAPATGQARIDQLLPAAEAFVQDVYPELVNPDVNLVPAGVPWLWAKRVPAPGWVRKILRNLPRFGFYFVALLPALVVGLFVFIFWEIIGFLGPIILKIGEHEAWFASLLGFTLLGLVPFYYLFFVRATYRILALIPLTRPRRFARWRKQLSGVLAQRYELGAGGMSLLMENDPQFMLHLQRFLAEHQVPYSVPLYNNRGRYLFASPGKVRVLADALLHAVGRGRDNELFVLLVDLLELEDALEPLLKALKVTLARHHQVLVICPWPPGIPAPGRSDQPSIPISRWLEMPSLARALTQATATSLQGAFVHLRQTLARLGVPVVCAAAGDPVQLILERLDRLRYLGLGRVR